MIHYFHAAVFTLLIVSLLLTPSKVSGHAQEASPPPDCPATTPEENEALVHRFFEEVLTPEGAAIAPEVVGTDTVLNWGAGEVSNGLDEFIAMLGQRFVSFPDLVSTTGFMVSEGDRVATLFTTTGTHAGPWQGIEPTGKTISWSGISIFRIECGRIAEVISDADRIGMQREIGVPDIPPASPGHEMLASTPVAATPCAAEASAEENAEVARRWFDEVLNEQDLAVLDEILDPAIVHHGSTVPDAAGIEGVTAALGGLLTSVPNLNVTVEYVLADQGGVAIRWSATGTQEGPFVGMEASGATLELEGTNVYRMACGKIVESWSELNALEILRELQEASGQATPVVVLD